jgi:hypothetical protein
MEELEMPDAEQCEAIFLGSKLRAAGKLEGDDAQP